MKYKALMLDVDGTLIPYDYDALPSKKVIETINKIQDKIHVCLVTGKSYYRTKEVLKALSLHSGFVVVNTGAHILDVETKEVVYERAIDMKDAEFIRDLLLKKDIEFYVKQEIYGNSYRHHAFNKNDKLTKPYMFYTKDALPIETAEDILKELSHLSGINAIKGTHKDPHKYHVNINHVEATKLHGINELIKRFNITKEEIVGIGDGYNDFALLMASGLKIAMGNAVEGLKDIANYVAPSVDEDGAAVAIEKFLLS